MHVAGRHFVVEWLAVECVQEVENSSVYTTVDHPGVLLIPLRVIINSLS